MMEDDGWMISPDLFLPRFFDDLILSHLYKIRYTCSMYEYPDGFLYFFEIRPRSHFIPFLSISGLRKISSTGRERVDFFQEK